MEVHHHPDLHHNKKKYKEYLLEFLMIFLAVTMGFFAESIREHINDHEKERQYAESLVSNLKEDTANFREVIFENVRKEGLLIKLLDYPHKQAEDTGFRRILYNTVGYGISFYSLFRSNDATMMQLKNGGGLRLIRRDHVADSIARWDIEVASVYASQSLYTTNSDLASAAVQQIADYSSFHDTTYYKNGDFTAKPMPFLVNDPIKIKMMLNAVQFELGGTQNYLVHLRERLPIAIRLIDFLKKEYDLD